MLCPATKEEIHDKNCIQKGFKIEMNKENLRKLYDRVEKNPDGSIKTRNVASIDRGGMTRIPMFWFLDPVDVWPVTHFWIRILVFLWNILAHVNSRDAFPNRQITMRGQKKGIEVNAAVKMSRKQNRTKSEDNVKMLIDQADPHGVGGTTGGHSQAMRKVMGEKGLPQVYITLSLSKVSNLKV